MLYLFITPEIDYPEEMPLPGIPSLLGMLKSKNIRCEYININSEFINYLDNKKINIYIDDLFYLYNEKKYLKFPTFYKKYFSNKKEINMKYINYLKKNISNFQVFKEKRKKRKEMYNYINYTFYLNFITSIKNSSLFNPLPIYYINEINFDINIEDILFIYNNISFVYRNFYEEKIEQIINKKPDIIGIQITSDKFAISGLILAYKIKQKRPNIHINIGGYFFEEYYKRINNLRNFFGIFFDSISIGESTTTVCDLIKYLNKEISIDKVTNILYLREEKLIFNKSKKQEKLDELPFQSFDGYNPDDYSLPEFVLPVRASLTKSCYWGNCIYCACSYNNKKSYRIMNVKRFVEEIEYLSKKYRTNYFAFWDNALPPTYLSEVADSLIKKNLNIKYSIYLRLDKKFDYNLLKKIGSVTTNG